jgi:hypothetical protein
MLKARQSAAALQVGDDHAHSWRRQTFDPRRFGGADAGFGANNPQHRELGGRQVEFGKRPFDRDPLRCSGAPQQVIEFRFHFVIPVERRRPNLLAPAALFFDQYIRILTFEF